MPILKNNSFHVETYGCTSNKADSYIIAQVLTNSNYSSTSLENAQFVIINTCAVKEQTEKKILARLKKLHELYKDIPDKHMIIAGCLPHVGPDYIKVVKKVIPSFSAIVGLNNLNDLPEIFRKIVAGHKHLIFSSDASIDKAKYLITYPPEKITGIIPISEGCLGSCTYCCVKNARGMLNCYDPRNILENVKYQLKQGIKQIYLTSQDCSTYNFNDTRLVDLVKAIVDLNYEFSLRIGMINPSFLLEDLGQLVSILNFKKVYQFLHVPIQSGSNDVLKKMRRTYLISDLLDKIDTLRKEFPYLTISTDIICGFPGETEYDFYRTINFVKWLKPEILNISKFTPRPGTVAKEMEQLDSKMIKERSIRLSKVFRNSLLHMNEKWMNREGEVLVLHEGSRINQAFGRNFAYKNVFIDDYKGDYGEFVKIKIEKIDGFNLFASKSV